MGELDCVMTTCKNLNYNFSQITLSVSNFAIFSLKIFQQKMAIFTKSNFFGQTLVFLPLRKPDLYISLSYFFFCGYYE